VFSKLLLGIEGGKRKSSGFEELITTITKIKVG
jgi:hypothetical protein